MQDIALGDTSVRVNDGSYHVIRFIRTGANATLQIDDFKTQRKNPSGRQMLVFNTQNLLQIGGKWNEGGLNRIDRPFIGVMAGFVFNGLRPLDLAKETHPLTKIQGKYCVEGMAVPVVEFSKLERFLHKNRHTQRKLLNIKF